MNFVCRNCNKSIVANKTLSLRNMPINNEILKKKSFKKEYKYYLSLCRSCNLIQLLSSNYNFLKITPFDKQPNNENSNHQNKIFNILKKKINLKKIKQVMLVSQYDHQYKVFFDKYKIKTFFLNEYIFKKKSKLNLRQEHLQRKICNYKKKIPNNLKFDLIIMSKLLEHTEKPSKLIIILKNFLKSKGKILVDIPDTENCFKTMNIATIWEDHLFYFNRFSIKSFFEKLNFKTIFIKKFFRKQESDLYGLFEASEKKSIMKMYDLKKNEFIFKEFKKNFYKTIEAINFKISSFRKKIFFLGCGHNLLVFLRQCNLQSKINKIIDDNKSKINKYPNNIDTKIVSGKYLLKIKNPIIVTSTPPELDNLIKKKLIKKNSNGKFFSIFPTSKFYITKNINI
ncbi:class I SAM-dependent methyltransferase [Candidatus Pelagibacter sp.]|nr:class I SAM-dependent methyltransferase [Candidatus Pelagibacter sp.]